jgi:hypothetical protein
MAEPFEVKIKISADADPTAVEFMEGAIRGMAGEVKARPSLPLKTRRSTI